MKRKKFLIEFLGALGAEHIEWHKETDHYLSGTVVNDKSDPEDTQDFCWHLKEQEAPNTNVLNLAKLLHKNDLVSIDKITMNREDLRNLYNTEFSMAMDKAEFNKILDILEEIEVNMVDDGKEIDVYFIHE